MDKKVLITEHAFARAEERHGIGKEEFQQICEELFRDSSVQSYRKKGRVRAKRVCGVLRIMIGEKGEHPRIIPVGVKGDSITTVFPSEEERSTVFLEYKQCIQNSRKKIFKFKELEVYLPFEGYKAILRRAENVSMEKNHTILALLPDGTLVNVIMQVHCGDDKRVKRVIRIIEIRQNPTKGKAIFKFRRKDV